LTYVQDLIQSARRAGKPVFVDPKRNNFNCYKGATVLTPNRREFEVVVGPCDGEKVLSQKGLEFLKTYDLHALVLTRGEQGMTLIWQNQPEVHLPALTKQVYDVTGAGDTVIACLALAYVATKKDLAVSAQLANIAASIVVGKLGAATVSPAELRRAIQIWQFPMRRGVLSEAELKIVVEDAKAHGECIVMTGGCFDILHAGHVTYLERAKSLGDRLIVAVNNDASVSQLKGVGRPVINLSERMAVLTGLYMVDWVVSFDEVTPERLIKSIAPDIWVKGGDYQLADLPEAATVRAYGGQVQIMNLVTGCSTSAIISAVKGESV